MDNQTISSNNSKTLEQLNAEFVEILMPYSILVIVYLILGITGNSAVLYIYLKRFQTYSEGRYFIPILAAIDMIACIINCSGMMCENMFPLTYSSDIGCKLERFLCLASTATSIFTLLLIAIDRYLKIGRPFRRQMTKKWKIVFVAVSVLSAVIVSTPLFVFSGSVTDSLHGITIYLCNSFNGEKGGVMLSFYLFLCLIVMIEMGIISVLYFRICRRLSKHEISKINVVFDKSSTDLDDSNDKSCVSVNCAVSNEDKSLTLTSTIGLSVSRALQNQSRKIPRTRITTMFIVITITFALSYIPEVVFMLIGSSGFQPVETDLHLRGFLQFLKSLYILNNFSNPFIYSCMDRKLQKELKGMCSCFCKTQHLKK